MVSSQIAYQRTLRSAKLRLIQNFVLQQALLSIPNTHPGTITSSKQRKQLNELATLGLVNLNLDDTYNLTNVGKVLVREFGRHNKKSMSV
ncbi:MAG TPA: hypothetical protein VH415_04035 [Nitrososphaeraceae archaeon]|jgi:hypothetical protein